MKRNGKLIPSLQPDSAESISLIRLGTLVLNWLFERMLAANTGSVGVKHAATTKAVAQSVWKINVTNAAQI
jgi:hypothetical protein